MIDPAVAALLGVVLGVALKALVDGISAAVRVRREDRLALEERLRPWQIDRLRATRELLVRQLEAMLATARGDARRASTLAAESSLLDGDISLLGDADLVAEYQSMLIELRNSIGQSINADLQKRSALVIAHILAALDAQTERLLRGMPLLALSDGDRRRLFDPDELAERMRLVDEPPTVVARLAAAILSWRERDR